jgi:MSHA biogenesis protein MshJ
MNGIKQFLARIDELNLRERAIVFGGLLIVLFLGWYTYLMEPLMQDEKRLQSELNSKRDQLRTLNSQFEQMTGAAGKDPAADHRRNLDRLNQQVVLLEQDLKDTTANLVTPESMPEILRMVLNKSRGLTLMRLTGLGGTPLVVNAPARDGNARVDETGEGDLGAAFKHGMQIEFSGNFFETLDYIRALEGLDKGFFWDTVKYEVLDYPDSVTTITLYTLSLNQDWIRI